MPKRLKIFFNYFLAPVLMIWLCINLYNQVVHQQSNATSWAAVRQAFYGSQVWKIILACLLVAVNWGIESRKWQLLIAPLQKISFFTAIKATLAGTSFAANTPNRMGEYFGRMIYIEEGKRLQSISLTITGSFSQLIITLLMGSIGMLMYQQYVPNSEMNAIWLKIICIGSFVVAGICLLIYYKLEILLSVLKKIPFVKKYQFFFEKINELPTKLLTHTLLLSLLRYLVFVVQYILVLSAFQTDVSIMESIIAIAVMFLILAVIPSFVILEAGIRGTVSVAVFKVFTINAIGIMASGYFIWLINLMAPALIGVLLLIGKKVFKR